MTQLGTRIKEKRKRKGWSQTVLGDRIGMSTATIHRIEHGEKIPTDSELILLADILQLDINQLLQDATIDHQALSGKLVPSTSYQCHWEYAHPADYSGRVWIQIYPQAKNPEELHVKLTWGAWQYRGVLEIGQHKSITLWHYKFNDGQGLPLLLDLSHPCYVVFGKDNPPDKPVLDIINCWKRIQPMSLRQFIRFLVDFVSVYLRWHWQKLQNIQK